MKFKTMDDIDREKHNEGRVKMRTEISEDINDVLGNVFGKPKTSKKKGIFGWIITILKWVVVIFLIVLVADLVLGSVWLLQFFLKSLFGIG